MSQPSPMRDESSSSAPDETELLDPDHGDAADGAPAADDPAPDDPTPTTGRTYGPL